MNKEKLIALGLTEEQANAVVEGYGTMIPKSRFDEKNEELKEAYKTITKHELDLEAIKPKLEGNDNLLKQIEDLQLENTQAKENYESELTSTRLANAVKFALHGKVQDLDIVSSLLDKTSIELDENGNIKGGLDEQIASLKEAKSFLFVPDQVEEVASTPPPTFTTGNNAPPSGEQADPFATKLADILK